MAANSLTLYKTHIQLRSFRWLPDTSIPSTFQLYVSNGIVLANTTPLQEVVQLPMECFPQEIRLKQLARSTLPQRPRSENRQIWYLHIRVWQEDMLHVIICMMYVHIHVYIYIYIYISYIYICTYIIWFHLISCHFMSFHVMSYYIVLCHIPMSLSVWHHRSIPCQSLGDGKIDPIIVCLQQSWSDCLLTKWLLSSPRSDRGS